MAHPVIVVVVSGLPGTPVIGGADGSAVGLGLHDGAGEVDGIEVSGITYHVHTVNVQVHQIANLHGDVGS